MKQPNSRNEFSNNGLQATTHKVFAMRTLSLASHLSNTACGSCLNPDVGIRKMGYSTTNGPSTTVNGKSIDHAATISDRSRA